MVSWVSSVHFLWNFFLFDFIENEIPFDRWAHMTNLIDFLPFFQFSSPSTLFYSQIFLTIQNESKVDLPEIKGQHRKFRTLVTSYIGKVGQMFISSFSLNLKTLIQWKWKVARISFVIVLQMNYNFCSYSSRYLPEDFFFLILNKMHEIRFLLNFPPPSLRY